MARYRQDSKPPYKLIPIDESAIQADRIARGGRAAIHGDIEAFVSPVDGTVISDRKALREHNKRNNVVNADEFTPEFYARKAKERADFYQGKRSPADVLKSKKQIYETWVQAERQNGH